MSKDLTNKTAIVTGGARDIGRASCLKLAENGASVVVNYFVDKSTSVEQAEETVNLIKKNGGKAIAVEADATKPAEIRNLVDETRKAFGDEIHILVNVAGGLIARKKVVEMDEEFLDIVLNVNLKSVFLVTQAVLPYMDEGGSIINFSSLAARDGGGAGASAYAASKGGVMTFTRALAKELSPQKIRVNSIAPGIINTTFHDTFTPDEGRKKVAGMTLLGREGSAEEIADSVVFLASDNSSYITGSSLELNAGLNFI